MITVAKVVLVATGVVVAATGCALNRRPSLPAQQMAELWQEPVDIERRNLLVGPGSAAHAPKPGARYTLKSIKTSGTQPGFDVKDSKGQEWSVKVGVEAGVEVAVSRLVWAIGYHQPEVYHVKEWTLVGDGPDRVEEPARFRFEPDDTKKSEWSWRDNPFLGTRPMAGLFAMMVLVNNWDIKAAQNRVYETENGGKTQRAYLVRDLGASLGKTAWIRLATKADPEDFEKEPFIDGVEDNRVKFHYQGAYLEPQLHASVTPDDVRWLCSLLNRLSPEQMNDAFRAGGFSEAEGARYVRRLRQKVAEGLKVGMN